MEYKKKLIEVALPLEAINAESAREKSIRHGHPSTLHLWWARRPLAACRAVLFASLVDDPSEYMPDEKSADEERERRIESGDQGKIIAKGPVVEKSQGTNRAGDPKENEDVRRPHPAFSGAAKLDQDEPPEKDQEEGGERKQLQVPG